ncbi:hypothetical protein BH10ACI4_BH10ACI4_11440 [soil metagenome]
MIEFTTGDMFAIHADARVNTVNTEGVMGAGVALAFKHRYPEMFADYRRACKKGLVRPGSLHIWKNLTGDWVINFPTKREWRDPSRYEDIAVGLKALREYLSEQGPISVALPALGCGNGGLEWSRVSSMISESLRDLDAHIYAFAPDDSRKAGQSIRHDPTEAQLGRLAELGFTCIGGRGDVEMKHDLWTHGNRDLLDRKWVAILPSKEPGEREFKALDGIARQMSQALRDATIALIYANRSTELIVEIFSRHNVRVVLILPFGPLSKPSIARTSSHVGAHRALLVSLASVGESWNRSTLAKSSEYLRKAASSVLISDPNPGWLSEKTSRSWGKNRLFYVFYGPPSPEFSDLYKALHARPLTRRADNGEPNVSALITESDDRDSKISNQDSWHFAIELRDISGAQFRNLAEAVDGLMVRNGTLTIDIPAENANEELYEQIKRVLKGSRA